MPRPPSQDARDDIVTVDRKGLAPLNQDREGRQDL